MYIYNLKPNFIVFLIEIWLKVCIRFSFKNFFHVLF
jgi:hypothetical protein